MSFGSSLDNAASLGDPVPRADAAPVTDVEMVPAPAIPAAESGNSAVGAGSVMCGAIPAYVV